MRELEDFWKDHDNAVKDNAKSQAFGFTRWSALVSWLYDLEEWRTVVTPEGLIVFPEASTTTQRFLFVGGTDYSKLLDAVLLEVKNEDRPSISRYELRLYVPKVSGLDRSQKTLKFQAGKISDEITQLARDRGFVVESTRHHALLLDPEIHEHERVVVLRLKKEPAKEIETDAPTTDTPNGTTPTGDSRSLIHPSSPSEPSVRLGDSGSDSSTDPNRHVRWWRRWWWRSEKASS